MATLTPEQFAEELHRAGESEFARIIKAKAIRIGFHGEAEAKKNIRNRLRKRSGNLIKSPTGRVLPWASGVQVELSGRPRSGGEPPPYLMTQEEGATIRPKKKKWLAIPNEWIFKGAQAAPYQTARDYPNPLQFVHLEGGRAMLWDAKEEKSAYSLLKKVTIKPKWFMRDAFKSMQLRIPMEFDDAMQAALGFTVGRA